MKAIAFSEYGSVEVLKIVELETPIIHANQILIETKAFGINPIDWKLRSGIFKDFIPLPLPFVLGYELSGIIKNIGPDVKNFKIGDRIYAHANHSYAEYVAVDAAYAHVIPDALSFEEAASLPSNTQVAYAALKLFGELKAGQKVLIHAGSGGVGIAAIQIAKSFNAYVATTVSTHNIDLVKGLGADEVIDYTLTSMDQVETSFDLIIDTIGGETQIKSWNTLTAHGCLVSLISDERNKISDIKPSQTFHLMQGAPENTSAILHTLISEGKIKAVIDQVYPFDDIASAQLKSEKGHVSGKIVVRLPNHHA